ncbi:hypothetical protein BRC94_10275 [Halobacteriales archaeon QS_5_70_17]|nr:MAG: hypothetical protein BRC94_10275 [Halobacteriales archaeon QS_5_70_17]
MSTDDVRGRSVSGNRSLAGAIAAAVAETKGVAPESLPPLYESIDPDALERLFAPCNDGTSRARGRAVFPVAGCEVTVRYDGAVSVRERGE